MADLTKEVEFINDYGNKGSVDPDKEDPDQPAKPDKEDPNDEPKDPVNKPKDPVEKPKDPTNKPNKNETEHTANETHVQLWISLLLGSACILAAIIMFNSKRKQV